MAPTLSVTIREFEARAERRAENFMGQPLPRGF
jgi:hypothetical protein